MCFKSPFSLLLAAAFAASPGAYAQTSNTDDKPDKGHSAHGTAFDIGPRQKPWVMEGIGVAPFPITTKNPEVQQWFNQGNALLHSFWYYEAERSFRWCLKLEPDNAMAYWGLARATSGDRSADFLREAVKRKDKVTERERLYIEALEAVMLPDPVRDDGGARDYKELRRAEVKKLETLCVKYPDDMEARALLAFVTMGDSRYGAELIVREILAYTTGITTNPSRHWQAAARTPNWCRASATPSTCRDTSTASWACGTRRRCPWMRPRAWKSST